MSVNSARVAVIGGGPAGLMAAEVLREAGAEVDVFDAMGSVGRKFLIAGKGGLNLTHSEHYDAFVARFAEAAPWVAAWLRTFDATALRQWARGLGVETMVGTSGRVFPEDLKAAPLLRGWVRRLRERGVRFHLHHRWRGWNSSNTLRFATPQGEVEHHASATLLALGGGSWPQLGSDGTWLPVLASQGIDCAPLRPSNCGFECDWSQTLASKFAGTPVKPVVARAIDGEGVECRRQGEFIITAQGVEGSLIYALSAPLRDAIERDGSAVMHLDLAPDRSIDWLTQAIARPRGKRTLGEHLRRQTSLSPVKLALLHEVLPRPLRDDAGMLAAALKSLPLRLWRTRPLAEAISSAGGVRRGALDDLLMLHARPGVFCAGEMLDWEAPTGGYLLTASIASGRHAAHGVLQWLATR